MSEKDDYLEEFDQSILELTPLDDEDLFDKPLGAVSPVDIDALRQQLNDMQMELQALTELVKKQQRSPDELAAQNALFEKLHEQFKQSLKKSLEHLNRATVYTVTGVSDAMKNFRAQDFQSIVDKHQEQVKKVSLGAISHMQSHAQPTRWKSLATITAIAMAMSLLVSTVMISFNRPSAEVVQPQVKKAGELLVKAWPQLSENERQRILRSASNSVI